MNLLIVDDEKQIREGMKNYIARKQFKFQHIVTARDGNEALYISKDFKPDLLITDIMMPKIDGLELAAQMKALYPDMKIVIISGVKEIAFMKSALKLSVVDYILKPIDLNELNPVLEKIVSTYETETIVKAEMLQLQYKFSESMPILRDRFLTSVLKGELREMERAEEMMKVVGIRMDAAKPMAVVNIHLSNEEHVITDTLAECAILAIQERLHMVGSCAVFRKSDLELIGIVNCDASHQTTGSLYEACCAIGESLKVRLAQESAIGIGCVADNMMVLSNSYESSIEAVNQCFLRGMGKVVTNKPPVKGESNLFLPQQAFVDDLILYIQACDKAKVQETLGVIMEPYYNLPYMHMGAIQTMRVQIAAMVMHIFNELKVAAEQKHNLGALLKLQTLHSVEKYITTMLFMLSDYFQHQRKKKSTHMISKIMDLTETRFNEPLNVQYVAECMHLSPNYFSTMFKQETGINYMDYLTNRRLGKSLDLILNSTYKISEIAQKVGYPDANYFAKIFKKYFGRTPSQYREDVSD